MNLPVRVFINCFYALEVLQAILKFDMVSDIISTAELDFTSVTHCSVHIGDVLCVV